MSQQDYFIQFARELGNLNGNLTAVLKRIEERMAKNDEMMASHEARISMLECKDSVRKNATTNGDGGQDLHCGSLPRWVVYVIVGLLSALLGALGVKIPGVM